MSSFASAFTPVSSTQAQALLSSGEKAVLFIGRSSCPYCRLFEPKLTAVAQREGLSVAFLNSEDATDSKGIQELRSAYGVPTVPGLLVADKGEVKVVCDSSLSEEAITAFIAN